MPTTSAKSQFFFTKNDFKNHGIIIRKDFSLLSPMILCRRRTEDLFRHDSQHDEEKNETTECSTTRERGHPADRVGLINRTINLRDLKFELCGSSIVKVAQKYPRIYIHIFIIFSHSFVKFLPFVFFFADDALRNVLCEHED